MTSSSQVQRSQPKHRSDHRVYSAFQEAITVSSSNRTCQIRVVYYACTRGFIVAKIVLIAVANANIHRICGL